MAEEPLRPPLSTCTDISSTPSLRQHGSLALRPIYTCNINWRREFDHSPYLLLPWASRQSRDLSRGPWLYEVRRSRFRQLVACSWQRYRDSSYGASCGSIASWQLTVLLSLGTLGVFPKASLRFRHAEWSAWLFAVARCAIATQGRLLMDEFWGLKECLHEFIDCWQ